MVILCTSPSLALLSTSSSNRYLYYIKRYFVKIENCLVYPLMNFIGLWLRNEDGYEYVIKVLAGPVKWYIEMVHVAVNTPFIWLVLHGIGQKRELYNSNRPTNICKSPRRSNMMWILFLPEPSNESCGKISKWYVDRDMMTSWHGYAFRIIGPLWGDAPVTSGSPPRKTAMWVYYVFSVVSLNK